MTRVNRITLPALLASTLFAVLSLTATPAAAGETAQRAVSQCRTEMLSHFPEGAVRTYRIADISGNSRRTRVAINVTADRRYRFECATDGTGRIVTASFDPPRGDSQLAAGQ